MRRQRRIRLDHVMRQELARTFSVEFPGRIVLGLEPKTGEHGFHYRITTKELREELDIARVGFPILGDDARHERVRYEQRNGARSARVILSVEFCAEFCRQEVHATGAGPSLDGSSAHLTAKAAGARELQGQQVIGELTGEVRRRLDYIGRKN